MNITYSFIIEKFGNEFGMAPAHCYYAILSQLSTYFNNSVIVDLGTLRGDSAVALAYNKSNKVYTYDIEHSEEAAERIEKEEFQNIKYIIGSGFSGLTTAYALYLRGIKSTIISKF